MSNTNNVENKNIPMTTKDGRSVTLQHVIGETSQALVTNELGRNEVLHYSQLVVSNPTNSNVANCFS